MSHSPAEKRRVFLAYRSLFSGNDANIRQVKKVRKVVLQHAASFKPILTDFGPEKTVAILKVLLDLRVFQSDIQAKITFPELFQTTPARTVQRAESENEVSRSEAEALEELVSGDKIAKSDENADYADLRKLNNTKAPKPITKVVPSLYPASIPYNIQHLILTTAQRLLEECCFEFAFKWTPALLEDKDWNCPEAVELTLWTEILTRISKKLPAEAISNASGIPLSTVFSSIAPLRHSAVHRLSTSAQSIQRMIQTAIRLALALGDTARAASLEAVEAELDRRIEDMQLNKNFLENRLDEQLHMIREQRADLDRQETEAVDAMVQEDLENKILVGSILEAVVRDTFGLHTEWGNDQEKGLWSASTTRKYWEGD